MADGLRIAQHIRDEFETVVVRLLEVADRCSDPSVQHELMRLGDRLVKLIDETLK
jgi:hypothetical protein